MEVGAFIYFGLFGILIAFLIYKRIQEYIENKKNKK